jgi:hypothetical protein
MDRAENAYEWRDVRWRKEGRQGRRENEKQKERVKERKLSKKTKNQN